MKCPKCHSENPDTNIFCGDCGTQLIPFDNIQVSSTRTLETPIESLSRGRLFAGRYEIIEELGRGGMGAVYRVEDTKIREEIALKLIRPEISSDKKTIERFQNELKIARKIRHKNVSGMFDLGEEKGTYYITMEYVPGQDLKSLIRQTKRLAIPTAISITKQICEGLAEAHRHGVIHRDLKSSNVIIDRQGNARIMDFGIARSLKEKGITDAGVMIGTPEYMSPEQAEAKEVDQRSDIYSLGVILFEMLTGRVPFEGDTALSIAMKQKFEAPKNPKGINPQIPDDLCKAVLKCLEKERLNRYQTIGEIKDELERIEQGIRTPGQADIQKKPLMPEKNRVILSHKRIVFSLVIAFVITLIGLFLWSPWRKSERAPWASAKPSIAVLPIEDYSPQGDQEYFCNGMTDGIIMRVNRLDGWKVIPTTTMMRYRNSDKSIKEIGQELDVSTILEGSLSKEGDDIHINAKLIRVEDSVYLWSEGYEEKLKGVFDIQKDIAEKIVSALEYELSPTEKQQLGKRSTNNITAYDYYLKGREYYSRYIKQDNEHAIELFKEALKLDQDFALAYAGLSDAYTQRYKKYGFSEIWLDEAINAGKKAVELDKQLSEGYKALGLAYEVSRSTNEAIEAYQTAVRYNPNNIEAIGNLADLRFIRGELFESWKLARKVNAIDPTYFYAYHKMAYVHLILAEYNKAEEFEEKALLLNPNYPHINEVLHECFIYQGKFNEERARLQQWYSTHPSDSSFSYLYGDTEFIAGNFDDAQKFLIAYEGNIFKLDKLIMLGFISRNKKSIIEARSYFNQAVELCNNRIEKGDQGYEVRLRMASIYACLEEKELMMKWLEQSKKAGLINSHRFRIDPIWSNYIDDIDIQKFITDVEARVDLIRTQIEKARTE